MRKLFKKALFSTAEQLPWIKTQMARAPFEKYDCADYYEDPLEYEKAVMLAKLVVDKWVPIDKAACAEADQVKQAGADLREFHQFREFLGRCRWVQKSAMYLRIKLGADIMNSNVLMTKEVS